MNSFYSRPDEYYQRWLAPLLRQAIEETSVLVLTGARQVGKTTLLLNEEPFREWRFLTLDDFDVLRQASQQPEALWAGADRVVLDEVQKAPGLLGEIKQAVDSAPGKTKFVLSGSANLLLMRQVSESLAGRAIHFVLHPLTLGEIHQTKPPQLLQILLGGDWPGEGILPSPTDPIPYLLRGFMPALLRLDAPSAWVRWWDGYVATYLERDLRQISQIDALVDFRRVMEFLALRSAQLLNQSGLARDAALSQATVYRYLSILETTHLFERLPAYTSGRSGRILKMPKVAWDDPGLAVYLSGYYQEDELRQSREAGSFFEILIYHHLRVLAQLMTPPARLYTWRTTRGQEVDFVLEHGRKALAIEVKQSGRPTFSDAAGLRAFLKDHPTATGGLLLHSGAEIRRLDERILAVPWTMITG